MLNEYESFYEDLLKKSENPSMNRKRIRSLCIENYKTINNLDAEFMKIFFKLCKTNRAQREQSNQVFFGTKNLRIQGPRVWNALPFNIKSKENLQVFRYVIKSWSGSKCSYNICFNFNI